MNLKKRISDVRLKLRFIGFDKKQIDEFVEKNYSFLGRILFLPYSFEKEVNEAYREIRFLYNENLKLKNALLNQKMRYGGVSN